MNRRTKKAFKEKKKRPTYDTWEDFARVALFPFLGGDRITGKRMEALGLPPLA